jgi:ferrochelatase
LLAEKLGLSANEWQLTFQSRFGKAEWLKPYTDETLKALPAQGVKNLHVVCPGFPADCLETLEEIAMEGKEDFLHAGGEKYEYIPALNDSALLIRALGELAMKNMQGWLDTPPTAAALEQQVARAKTLGASN